MKSNKVIFIKEILLIGLFISFMFFSYFYVSQARELECKDYKDEELTQDEYQEVIEICDLEISKERDVLVEKRNETSGVKNEINNLDGKIKISESFINQKIAKANRLKRDINSNISDVDDLRGDIDKISESLSVLLYEKNILETNTALEAILISDSLSNFFAETEIIKTIGKRISEKIKKAKTEKESLEELSIELGEREVLERQLAKEREIEAESIRKNKEYKDELLKILKNEAGVLEDSISVKEKSRQVILKKKYPLASGEAVTFGEAYNAINPYKGVLGMDPAFILAILFQESGSGGKIGGNIGGCTYDQANSHGNTKNGYTVMSNSQKPSFLTIMKGLDRNASEQKISCPIPRDGSYGGAMGPAQFMPATWLSIRDRAADVLGKKSKELSPFVNGDAFIASAIYLKDQYYSKSCTDYANKYSHISSERTLRERCAASRYYAGGAWFTYRMTYGQPVVNRANRFRADIAVLND